VAVLGLADQLLIGHEAQEGVTEARPGNPVLLRHDAPSRSLTIGKCEKDYPLIPTKPIPYGLMRICRLRQS